jgi:alpha-L-fucosidase
VERREFGKLALAGVAAATGRRVFAQDKTQEGRKFAPEWDSLRKHTVPDWYQNAKLGIFIHWGLYSVPAWATPSGELGKVDPSKWFYNNPYAEWYLNTLRLKGSPTYEHHIATYGKDFDYYRFAKTFNEQTQKWQPETWAALFRNTGARYAVLTTKHHDGFRLWPSEVTNPHANGRMLSAQRDLVGDLTSAVRASGLKMGLYYSGGLDWTFTSEPIATTADLRARIPQTAEYAQYADAHWRELMRRYQPAVLWNDIGYPKLGQVPEIFADYYNSVPGGVVNNRFSVDFADFTTPEYAKYDRITEKKWESCRGLGFSFGYNQVEGPEQVIAPDQLVNLLIDIVSKNGNLLLNIGPKPDGSISDIQMNRLQELGKWLQVNGEGIFDTRPWARASAATADGSEVRFTRKADAVYVFYLKRPAGNELTIPAVYLKEGSRLTILGSPASLSHQQQGTDVKVKLEGAAPTEYALGLRITPAPWQMVSD